MYYFTHPHLITTHDVIFFFPTWPAWSVAYSLCQQISPWSAHHRRVQSLLVLQWLFMSCLIGQNIMQSSVYVLIAWIYLHSMTTLCPEGGWRAMLPFSMHVRVSAHTLSGWWELTWIICSVTCGCVPGVSYIDGWCLGWISFLVIPAVRCTQLLWSLFLPLDTRFLN